MLYSRIYSGEMGLLTPKPRGIFTTVARLVDAKVFSVQEVERYRENIGWLEKALPVPPFYADGNPERAITWFMDGPRVQHRRYGN